MKRVIITGPTGAIGMALIDRLVSQNIEVTAVVRTESVRAARIKESRFVKKIFCGLDNLKELPKLMDGTADVFYHFGWDGTWGSDRQDMYKQNMNVRYALDAVEVAAELGCKRFVGAGSQAEYGRYEGKLNEATPVSPENGYGMAKLCAGQMTRELCRQKGIEHVWSRILSVYGPYDGDNTMIMSVISKLLTGISPECTMAEQMWDYIYSKDVAKALHMLGQSGVPGRTYCIGSGVAAPLRTYIEQIRKSIDTQTAISYGAIPYADKQIMHLCADISQLKEDTGFAPEYTFAEGISETIEWVKKQKIQEKF